MLKTRIIPTLLYKDLGLVKGERFDSWRRVGALMQAIKVYALREVDELIFLDISATRHGRPPNFELIDEFADECFMPLTVGGAVRTLNDVHHLLTIGVDKVAINTAALEAPELIEEAANRFGSQCLVVSIDAKQHDAGHYEVFTHAGTRPTGIDPATLARRVEQLGCGEILLTSIDRDGTMQGYDTDLVHRVSEAVSVPVIASGGAGTYAHLASAIIDGRASAVAAASMFHFTEQTPLEAKRYLRNRGINVRL